MKTEAVSRIQEMRVSGNSQPNLVAGAIAGAIRENKDIVISVIGAGAMNQAVKSVAIANGFLAPNGLRLSLIPAFVSHEIDGQQRTMMKLELKRA